MNWDDAHPRYKVELGRRLLSTVDALKSKKAAAELVGISAEQLNKWMGLSGEDSIPKVPVAALIALAEAANVNLLWLAAGEGPMRRGEAAAPAQPAPDQRFVTVPRYNVELSAGNGSFADRAELLDHIPFTLEFFIRRLGRKPDSMVIVEAGGDSMLPTISDGDLVMIDTADKAPRDAIWAFAQDNALLVKRLRFRLDEIDVVSDNGTLYPPYTITKAQSDAITLIGRVVWVARRL